ncbi:hypothetical protein PVAG01_04697 [Phlyctema vagabunda]|uniref:BZIP domain-containing protein n=1 Tax=Phlyctema vagabunda TaxID=108571 RepID=A0ABR4PI33_9HELO
MDGQNNLATPVNSDIWIKDVDDWLGVTESRQRRKIQNRRNQRACRAKKRGASQNSNSEGATAANTQLVPTQTTSGWLHKLSGQLPQAERIELSEATTITIINLVKILQPNWEGNQLVMQRFEAFATRSYIEGIGALSILPSLSQFNFVRALFTNMEVLDLSGEEMEDEVLSPFNRLLGPFPLQPDLTAARFSKLPTALKPTVLQHSTPHHPWIDLLPMPMLRDNIFRQGLESFDEAELCHAMRGQAPDHNPGLLVWSDPWDPMGWEVTEEFIGSWGWVIAGCADLLQSTNTWRTRRGEKPLFRLSS